MKIEIWSDFVCPFCYIGKRRLENALDTFEHRDEVDLTYKSFQLDPNAAKSTDQSMAELLAGKYKIPVEQAKGMNAQMTEQAKEVGLEYHFDTIQPTNTFDAHRLAQYAKTQDKLELATEKLMHAYFTDSLNLSDHDTLTKIAAEAELDPIEVCKVIEGDQFSEEVYSDQGEAQQIGVTGVPFFVFNNKYAVSGAQPAEVFGEVLQKVWDEENKRTPLNIIGDENAAASEDDNQCADGSCKI